MESEVWKEIPGYEGRYKISSLGTVRSAPRTQEFDGRWGSALMKFPGKIMRASRTPAGYHYLSLSRDSLQTKHFLHRLVMLAFVGPSNLQVNHKNGDKSDNRLENLEYCTSQQNLLHCTRVLRKKIGERNGNAKLKENQIADIRNDKRFLREIAADYGVSIQAISHVKRGKNWALF